LTFTSSLFNTFPEAAELAVYDGTTFAGVVSATGSGEQTKTLALPGTGFRVITVVEGAQSVLNDLGGEQQGTFLVRVDFPMGSSATLVTPVRTANSLGFTADSNSNGFGSDVNPRDAYAVLLRPMLGYDVTLGGYGYKSWSRSLDTDAKQNAHVSTVVATHAGRALKQEVYNLGTNDAYLNMGTPAQVQAIATSTWSKLRAADPTVLIYCLTPFRCPSIENTPNQLGFTMAQYRAALAVAAEAVGGVQLWDGLEAVPEAQLASDGVHLTNAGHQSAANYVYAKLLAVAVPLILGDTYLKVGGSEAWRYAEFTTCLTFRKSATTGNYAILSCQTIDAPAGQSQGTYGIYTYDGTLRAGIYVNGTANEISLPMPAGDLLVTVLFKASPTARELRVNDAIVTAGGVPIPVNQFPLTIGAVRTGVGDATTVTGLKSPVTNFSFFSVYQTAAESSALMAAKGQITPAQLASPTCFSYGRLIRQNSGSTSLLDAKTGTASILILKPDGSAATAPVVPQVVFDTDLTRWSYGAGWVDSRANGGISNSPDYPAGAHHYLIPDPGNGPATISFNGSKFDYETAQASVYNFATRLIIDGTTIQDVGPGFTAVTGLGSGNHTLQVVNVPDSGRLASVCKFVFYPNS
jgi:lysophospholipase L1-like esterase